MAEMTPRERILTAPNHQEPDRLPMDFGGLLTTLHVFTHRELKRYLGMEGGEEQIRSYFAYVVEPDPRLVERFGRDTIPFVPNTGSGWQLRLDPEANSFVDEWGTKFYMPPDGYYFDMVDVPLAAAQTPEDLARYPWPDPRDPARMRGIAEAIRTAHGAGNKAIMMSGPRLGIWAQAWALRGLEQAFMDLVCNQELAEELAERLTEWNMGYWEGVLSQVGDCLDLVHIEGDLGGTDGPLFSPAVFRKIYKPRLARLISFIKARTRAKAFFHSCGSIYRAIPNLIECGVDVLNPVQVNARDMNSSKLKREFGKDLAFWGGGCDPVVLQNGTTREVETEVHRRIDDLAPGGGFVFGSIHNIQPNAPPKNIVTMFEAARRHGGYGG